MHRRYRARLRQSGGACGLPNDFASDPNLQQVVARTVEVGVRGSLPDQRLVWSADVFHTVNSNDIQFVATAANCGYFDNVGSTRRQGLDLALGGKEGGLHWQTAYSFVDATFQSNFEVSAESNSSADANGNILVRPGDRIPLIPRHTGRLVLDYQLSKQWDVGGNLVVASGSTCTETRTMPIRPVAPTVRALISREPDGFPVTSWSICTAPGA